MEKSYSSIRKRALDCLQFPDDKVFNKKVVIDCLGNDQRKVRQGFEYSKQQLLELVVDEIKQNAVKHCEKLQKDLAGSQSVMFKQLPYTEKVSFVSQQCVKVMEEGLDLIFLKVDAAKILQKNYYKFDALPVENFDKMVEQFDKRQ